MACPIIVVSPVFISSYIVIAAMNALHGVSPLLATNFPLLMLKGENKQMKVLMYLIVLAVKMFL